MSAKIKQAITLSSHVIVLHPDHQVKASYKAILSVYKGMQVHLAVHTVPFNVTHIPFALLFLR